MRMDFLKYFSYYSQKMMISPYYFGPPVYVYVGRVLLAAEGSFGGGSNIQPIATTFIYD
jgi:hypothetical protein